MSTRLSWQPILEQAAEIVAGYGHAVTLRQLFYRLVAGGILPNTSSAYKTLSRRSAEARRDGSFPDLADNIRSIERWPSFSGPEEARRRMQHNYRRDRTENQEFNIYVAAEKATMSAQLDSWFGYPLGLPVLALRGYSSQTLADEVSWDADSDGRPAVLLYAGDFDPTGEDILRDFEERADCFDEIVRVALTAEQVSEYRLPPQPGKASDSRAAQFEARYGALIQVELEALDPSDLRELYQRALSEFWDTSTFEATMERECADRRELAKDFLDDEPEP